MRKNLTKFQKWQKGDIKWDEYRFWYMHHEKIFPINKIYLLCYQLKKLLKNIYLMAFKT